ncbi:hypothetical protein JWJ90_22820, partial [Desulfobulbus rhabdoformis]|uniref:hypothetical protein n=1 Tax=Desulfobulbus rhabdoformis TaxID=34032 RepID=UPI00196451C1
MTTGGLTHNDLLQLQRVVFAVNCSLVYARHGRELMGCKSPVRRIQSLPFGSDTKVLADGKGVSARRG